tara:strand:- start:760 stop:876 length:117 start_codon:yes stop_codon:yes gene_type:complete
MAFKSAPEEADFGLTRDVGVLLTDGDELRDATGHFSYI